MKTVRPPRLSAAVNKAPRRRLFTASCQIRACRLASSPAAALRTDGTAERGREREAATSDVKLTRERAAKELNGPALSVLSDHDQIF